MLNVRVAKIKWIGNIRIYVRIFRPMQELEILWIHAFRCQCERKVLWIRILARPSKIADKWTQTYRIIKWEQLSHNYLHTCDKLQKRGSKKTVVATDFRNFSFFYNGICCKFVIFDFDSRSKACVRTIVRNIDQYNIPFQVYSLQSRTKLFYS